MATKMKMMIVSLLVASVAGFLACNSQKMGEEKSAESSAAAGGQANVVDDVSQKDVVKVAVGSKDHTTLVAAVKAAELVDVLANAGPFTVFAPTNAAFDKLPKEAVADLMKPENKSKLSDVLQHHVITSVYEEPMLTDGKVMNMVDGKNVKISRHDGGVYVDDAKIIASVRASNGIVHVIDAVVLPK